MTITLKSGTTYQTTGVLGRARVYQGAERDTLTFLFEPETADLGKLMEDFTEEACEAIQIQDGEQTYIHEHYTLRAGVGITPRSAQTGERSEEGDRDVAYVTMARTTPAEREMRALLSFARKQGWVYGD